MSKAKKIISMLLAIAMVLTVAPVSLTASAADATFTDPKISTVQFSVDTTATTEVIRVAAAAGSFSLGTAIVPATRTGIPQNDGVYKNIAYAGETPVTPKVVFKITGATLSETPSIKSTLSDVSFKAVTSSTSGNTTTYTWEIQSGTASAGTGVVFTIGYKVAGTAYEAYAYSHVEDILVMNGFLTYKKKDNGSDGCVRHSMVVQLRSVNMYSGMCQDETVSNRKVGYINYANTSPAEENNLIGMGSATDLSTAGNAYGSAAPNDSITGNEQGVLIKSVNDSTGTQRNMCYNNDTNKAESVIYIDKRKHSSLADLGLKMTVQNGEKSNFGYCNVDTVAFYSGHRTFGDEDGSFTSDSAAAAIMSISGTGTGNKISTWDGYITLPFGGTGPTTVSDSEQQYSMIINLHSNAENQDARCAGGINLDFYVRDTTDLYALYTGILKGAGNTYNFVRSTTGSVTFNKGVNPQANMYSTGWAAFEQAMKNAGALLVNPKAAQADIDAKVVALKNAYTNLGGYEGAHDVKAEHYLMNEDGTTTLLATQDKTVYAGLGSVAPGSTVIAYPANITGYKVTDNSPKSLYIAGKAGEETTLKFYYTAITYNLNVYTNTDQNGDGKIDVITSKPGYGTTVDLSTLEYGAKEFYKFDGFYKDAALTQKATNFTMPAETVTLYVKWVPDDINIDVVMIANGVKLGTKTYSVTPVEGATVDFNRPSEANQPSYEGYLFAEYYENEELTVQATWPRTYSVGDAHETIYARMVDVNGKVIFESNGGSAVPDSTFTAPADVGAPTAPTKQGYTFDGWYRDNGTFNNPVSWPVHFDNQTGFIAYAKWTAEDHKITFNLGGTTTKYDTVSIAAIQGPSDELIDPDFYPNEPLKFGYVFDGWSLNGVRYEFDGTNKYPTQDIELRAIWRSVDTSAFVDITSYEKLSGNYVETEKASVGDVVTFRMTSMANFAVGSSVFVFMYDSNFFELVNEGTSAFAVNEENEYISGINAKYSGVTNDNVLPWPDMDRTVEKDDGSNAYYKAMMIAIDPTITADDYYCAPMQDGKWLVEFQLRVKEGATGSGKVYMSNDWTRTEENLMGTQFYGWAKDEDESVADTYNSKVTPNLDDAYAVITIDEVVPQDTTVTIDANGGAWADSITQKSYSGRAETEITDYVRPEYAGYHLPDTNAWKLADSDVYWAEGYYEKEAQTGNVYFAQWLPNEYTINYYVDGALYATETALYNDLIPNQITPPTKAGYEIKGWSLTEGGAAVDLTTYKCPIDGANLYAIWGPRDDTPYTLKITYYNPVTGAPVETTQAMTGTTDSTVIVLKNAPATPAANTTYIEWADLPSVANGNFIFDEDANAAEITATIAADGSTVIEVIYRGKDVIFTYDANGGTFADGSTTKDEKKTFQSLAEGPGEEPTRPGYKFTGWAGVTFGTTRMAANGTKKANWTINKYPATFNVNGGAWADGTTTDQVVEVAYGSTITKPAADPVKEGYTFLGWAATANAEKAEALGTMDNETGKTFYAVYALTEYKVTYYVDGDETYVDKYHMGDAVTIRAAESKTGYTFSGWKINGADAADFTMAAADVTIEGTFEANYYDVIFDATGGYFDGDTTAKTKAVSTQYDSPINPPAQPTRNGYKFLGWAASATSTDKVTDYGTLTTTETVTFYALWEATVADYTINIYYMDTTGNYPDAAEKSEVRSGLVATNVDIAAEFKAEGNTNNKVGFTLDEGNSEFTGTIDADKPLVLTVKYSRNQYALSTRVDGVVSKVKDYYFEEAVAEPSAPADKEGYTFGGWAGYTDGMTMPSEDTVLDATWNVNSYTVTWDVDGTTKTDTVDYGAPVQGIDPSKTGHTFAGWAWTKTADGSAVNAPSTMPAYDITATATWTKNTYTITYRTYNGVYKTETVPYDDVIVLPEQPVREGYTFTGWSGYTDGMKMPAANQIFVAQWQINSYTVEFVVDGTVVKTGPVEYNAAIETPAAPEKEGHTFAGWSPAVPEKQGAADATYTATWTVNEYNVAFVVDGVTVQSGKVAYGAAVVAPADPEKEGYTFAAWSPAVPATQGAADATYTATWITNEYDVTFIVDGATVQSGKVAYGSAVAKPADPEKEGHTFAGWSPAVPATQGAANATYTATWTVNEYNVTFVVDGVTVQSGKVAYGAAVTAPADPEKEGYTFASWSPAVPATQGAADATYTAQWTTNEYTVTWDVDGKTTDETYAYGATINKKAAPEKEGHTFAAWEGYTDGMTMPAENKTFTATWTVNEYTVTWVVDGVTVKTDENVPYGTVLTAPADPEKEGHTFAAWEGYTDGDTMGAADVTYTAVWTTNEYTVEFVVDGTTVQSGKVAYGAAVNAPADPEKVGYTFAGWSPEVPATQGAADATYTAQWTINEYTITWSIDGVETTETYDYSETITVKADPEKTYYTFEGWTWTNTKTGEAIAEFTEMPAYDVTITAKFERVPVTLKLVAESTAVIDNDTNGAIVPGTESDPVYITGYIYGIASKLKKDALIANYLLVEGDGTIIVTPFKFNICGTGTKVELKDNVTGEIVETYYIVIFGDINGDSKIDSIDTGMIQDELNSMTYWSIDTEEQYEPWKVKAADIGGTPDENGKIGDGDVLVNDLAALREVVLDGAEIDQTNGYRN